MNEILDEIYKEYSKQKRRLLRATQSFLDNANFTEQQSQTLSKYHGIIQQVLEDVENAIQNNETAQKIIETSQNIEEAFNRYAKRLVHYDNERSEDYESDFEQIRDYIRKIVSSLTEKLNPESKNEGSAKSSRNSKQSSKQVTSDSAHSSKRQQRNDESTSNSKHNSPNRNTYDDNEEDFSYIQSVRGISKMNSPSSQTKRKESQSSPRQKQNDDNLSKTDNFSKSKIQSRSININNDTNEDEDQAKAMMSKSQIVKSPKSSISSRFSKSDEQNNLNSEPEEIQMQIHILQKQIKAARYRVNETEMRKATLQQQSVNWTNSNVIEEPDDADGALIDVLTKNQQVLEDRIQNARTAMDLITTEISYRQIQKEQLIESFKAKIESNQSEMKSLNQILIDDQTQRTIADKKIFDIEREISQAQNALNANQDKISMINDSISELTDQVIYFKNSNKELNSKIKNEKRNYEDLENEIRRIIDEMQLQTNFDTKYRQMVETEIKLFNAKREYDILVNETIPKSKSRLQKLADEVGHLGSQNKTDQIESELVNMEYIKEQILHLFQF